MSKSPAFQFYPKDFLSDAKVQSLTYEEIGWYTILLCYCWIEGSIPADPEKLLLLLRIPADPSGRHGIAMAQLLANLFRAHPEDPGRLVNPRLEREREAQGKRREERSRSGKMGADRRWTKNGTAMVLPSKENGTAMVLPLAKHSSSSSSSSANNNTPLTPQRGGDAQPKRDVLASWQEEVFTPLWEKYPKKDGRKDALRHFRATVRTPDALFDITRALDHYLLSRDVQRGFIKNGSTWFNNWRDWINWKEPPEPGQTPPVEEKRHPIKLYDRPQNLEESKHQEATQ